MTGGSADGLRPRPRRALSAEINVVPYIDVMLVLLVIFMVVTPLIVQGVDVTLPQVSAEQLPVDQNAAIIVTVDKFGDFHLEFGAQIASAVPLERLVLRVASFRRSDPSRDLLIRADGVVPYATVADLLARLQAVGVYDVSLVTQPADAPQS